MAPIRNDQKVGSLSVKKHKKKSIYTGSTPKNTTNIPVATGWSRLGKIRPSSLALWTILYIAVIVAIGLAGHIYMKYRNLAHDQRAPQVQRDQVESERILSKLRQVLLINESGQPSVAKVDSPEKLKATNPEFYKDALVDDYIIVYPTRAIIYRTSNNQIINIAPIVKTADQSN